MSGFFRSAPRGTLRFVSRLVARLGRKSRWFTGAGMYFYDRFFEKLDGMQKALNPCLWRGEGPVSFCIRKDRQCCATGEVCRWLKASGCGAKSLSCKLWLCASALRALEIRRERGGKTERRQIGAYLALRRRINVYCQLLNIPLKIRASKEDAFNPGAAEPLINISDPDWMDQPVIPLYTMHPAQ